MTDAPVQPVTIKKYANRRLYNTSTSSYVTLDDLACMVKKGIEFNVYDAKTSEDLTRWVLTQIIVEEEGKTGQNLLPIGFLRQLIAYYGDNLQWMVPQYLDHSMQALARNQEQIRGYFQNAFGGMFPFGTTFEEMGKQNLAMFERAMRLFSPFGGPDAAAQQEIIKAASSMPPAPKPSPERGPQQSGPQSAPQSAPSASAPQSSSSKPVASAQAPGASPSASSAAAPPKASMSAVSQPASPARSVSAAAQPVHAVPSPAPREVKAAAKIEIVTEKPKAEKAAAVSSIMPMPTPQVAAQATAALAAVSGKEVQTKIAALQRQLAELARSKA